MHQEIKRIEYVYTGFWDKYRLPVIVVGLLMTQVLMFAFIHYEGEKISKNPCSICAERFDEPVTFVLYGQDPKTGNPITTTRTYYADGEVETLPPGSINFKINDSLLNISDLSG